MVKFCTVFCDADPTEVAKVSEFPQLSPFQACVPEPIPSVVLPASAVSAATVVRDTTVVPPQLICPVNAVAVPVCPY